MCLEGGNIVKLIMHVPWCIIGCPFNNFHQDHMQRTSMGGQQAWLCRKFMVACEASGAREHGHDSKYEASSGRTNNARKWVDESVGRCNSWSTQARKSRMGNDHAGRKNWARGAKPPQAGRPRPADLAYKWCPPAPIFCRQVALSFLSLCAQVFLPRTTVDIAILSWAWLLKQFTPLIHSKSTFRRNFWKCLVTCWNLEF
jgi:hypothetical protein